SGAACTIPRTAFLSECRAPASSVSSMCCSRLSWALRTAARPPKAIGLAPQGTGALLSRVTFIEEGKDRARLVPANPTPMINTSVCVEPDCIKRLLHVGTADCARPGLHSRADCFVVQRQNPSCVARSVAHLHATLPPLEYQGLADSSVDAGLPDCSRPSRGSRRSFCRWRSRLPWVPPERFSPEPAGAWHVKSLDQWRR